MPRHATNMSNNSSLGNYGGGKKQTNMYNRNRSFGGKNNSFGSSNNSFGSSNSSFGGGNSSFGGGSSNYGGHRVGGLGHQVSPWLSQSSSPAMGGFGRNIASDQQAQLALASTLLNNLLKPASQLNKSPTVPPSLLSLNRSAPNQSSSFGGLSSNYGNRDFGRQNAGKVQKDFRKGDFKNKRFGDRKNKKANQPNRQANAGKKAADKKDVKEEVKVETMDVDQSTSEKKNETVTTETAPDASENSTPLKKDSETKKSKKDEPKVSYAGIPAALLFCHICRKHMWDDSSFEKHLEGKPHKMMVQELDISYGLKVDLLRHEMRVAEQQRENDIQRAQRKGKNNHKSQQRDFCAMCNLSFLGMLPAHRKNERHQRLKKFLHPKCNVCSKEFYTRLEWDDHKLTPAHLKKLAEIRKNTRPDLEDAEFDIVDFIEDIDDEFDKDNIELKVVGKRDPVDDTSEEKGEAPNGTENEKEETNEEKTEDEEFKKLPKYTPGIPVGENFMVEKTGSLCRVCNKFCLTSEDAKTHCQSVAHFNNVLKILKAQNKIVRKRRLNDSRAEDDATENVEGDVVSKKPKLDNEPTASEDTNGAVKVEQLEEKESGKDVYDPEDPGSENEKDAEIQKTPVKSAEIDKTNEPDATKVVTGHADSGNESKESAPDVKTEVETEVVTPVSQSPITTRRGGGGGRGRTPPVRGSNRARRARRH